MGRTLTNNFALQQAIQQSRGVLGGSPAWKLLEPNAGAAITFGPQISTVARNPISPNRQRRKGTIVDLDSSVEFEVDLTVDSWYDSVEGFCFARATNYRLVSGALWNNLAADNDVPGAGTEGFTHAAIAVAMPEHQLVYARGFTNAATNGLHEVDAASSTTATPVKGTPGIIDEAPGNTALATLETAGWRFTDLVWTDATNSLSSALTNPSTIGLTPGQLIYIGGSSTATRFPNGTAFARVKTVANSVGGAIVVDKITNDLGTGLNGGGNQPSDAVDLLFGPFIRNVPVDHSSFLERYFQFEGSFPDLFETDPPTPVANPDGFEYALDNLANTLAINMPGQDKVTLTLGFVGTDTEPPVDNASRKANASTPASPRQTTAFNTSSDFVRIRIADVDETGLSTDLTEMTTNISNNVDPEKVLGVLGARFLNYGNFDIDIETTALFTSPLVIARIRSNTTVSMDWVLHNDDGVVGFDIPSATLGNGGRDLPVNESVKVNLTVQAFIDATLGTSLGVSIIPFVPTT